MIVCGRVDVILGGADGVEAGTFGVISGRRWLCILQWLWMTEAYTKMWRISGRRSSAVLVTVNLHIQ